MLIQKCWCQQSEGAKETKEQHQRIVESRNHSIQEKHKITLFIQPSRNCKIYNRKLLVLLHALFDSRSCKAFRYTEQQLSTTSFTFQHSVILVIPN